MNRSDTLLLPPRYLPPADYYAVMLGAEKVLVDTSMRFEKRRKCVHRTVIADANGEARLTVPICKPVSMTGACWKDIEISGHDEWWNIHFTALQSAYGRTPYFEYYADDFAEFYSASIAGSRLVDYLEELDRLVRRLAGISTPLEWSDHPAASDDSETDLRRFDAYPADWVEYYQVRANKRGFMAGMSIVDLLFNYGPETVTILEKMLKATEAPSTAQ